MADSDDRARGILTPKDRELLTDREAYEANNSRQMVYEREKDIKQRVTDSLLDLTILLEHLPASELREITGGEFGMLNDDEAAELLDPERDDTDIAEALRDGVGLLYLAAADRPEDQGEVVEEGVRRGAKRRGAGGQVVDVDLEVEAFRTDWLASKAAEKIERGIDLTDADVRALLETGRVPADEVAAYVRDGDEA